jgi:hypothetical protein
LALTAVATIRHYSILIFLHFFRESIIGILLSLSK